MGGTPRAALLALPRVDSVDPTSPLSCNVRENQLTTCSITHPDVSGTLFATFHFPAFSLNSVNGVLICDSCVVAVTVTVTPGLYGFTVTPSSLTFIPGQSATVDVSYAKYGDLAVFDSSARYPTDTAYDTALELWWERNPGRWIEVSGSAHSAAHVVTAPLHDPGAFLIAAPR